MTLMPGEELEKDIVLSEGVRRFVVGHGSVEAQGRLSHIPTGYECMSRFDMPEGTASVRIQAEYRLGADVRQGFRVWFGYDPGTVELWEGECKSPEIAVGLVVK